MKHRRSRPLALVVAIALTLSACAWGQVGGNAARNHANPYEPNLTPDNVGNLKLAWQVNGTLMEPLLTDKFLYTATQDGNLRAYAAGGPASAEGAPRCSGTPVVCTPVWFSKVGQTTGPEIVVDGDQVFITAYQDGQWGLTALDANPASCPATPTGCAPRWTGHWTNPSGFTEPHAMVVADGKIYVLHVAAVAGRENSFVVVFDARGVTNCTAGPSRTCSPLFRADIGSNPPVVPALAVGAGRIFISRIGPETLVFDAAGQSGCSNGICSPIYGLAATWDVSISGTTAYANSGGFVKAFDATGATGCSGTPRVCQPKWTGQLHGSTQFGDPPTVSNGKVLVAHTEFEFTKAGIEAFDAAGIQGCTGSPAVCQPLWSVNWLETAGEQNHISATPTLAIVSGWTTRTVAPFTTQTIKTFDLAGHRSCNGTPKLCTALSTLPAGADQNSSVPAVAFGRVAVRDVAGIKVFALAG